ncbi:hypothetical protein CRUP_032288 [Coryphaenoides rupestris]|nr:hypothetical protein CRUP_032287 [Coryphaenoides rupestris]KAG7262721.1 hypothetical protein CRUP_032288 [Coryphaenoides rupestris]
MTDVEPVVTDFASTGRTGRRNAIPDLLGSSNGSASSAELSNKLAELSVVGADVFQDADGAGKGSSSSQTQSTGDGEEKAEGT